MILLGVFAVWLVWQTLEPLVEAERWMWYLTIAALGVGWQCLDDWSLWWQGIGIGGGALALGLVADLVLLATDWVKVGVLRNRPR